MFEKLSNFSMDLYDIDTNITFEMSTDHITINFNKKQQIMLWINKGKVYPQIFHDFNAQKAVSADDVLKVLNVVKKYTEEACNV